MKETESKRKPGRPVGSSYIKFKEETIENIIKGIRVGLSYKSAAINAGVSQSAFTGWMDKGRQGKKPYKDFVERMDLAVEEAKVFHLTLINRSAKGGHVCKKTTVERDAEGKIIKTIEVTEETAPCLKASTWLLERRHPEEFGPRQEVALTNKDNPFEVGLFGQVLIGSSNEGIEEEDEG